MRYIPTSRSLKATIGIRIIRARITIIIIIKKMEIRLFTTLLLLPTFITRLAKTSIILR